MLRHRGFAVSVLFVLFTSQAHAQDVWVVDAAGGAGSDFATLTAAFNGAAAGDVLLVRGGTYDETPPPITRELTVVVETGATATLTNDLEVFGVPAGEHVLVSGLTIDVPQNSLNSAVDVQGCAGTVTFVDCVVLGNLVDPNGNGDGVSVSGSASVTLVRTTVTAREVITLNAGSSRALTVTGSSVALYDCALTGGEGTPGAADSPFPSPGRTGGAALRVSGTAPTSVFAAGTTLTGGTGGEGGVGVFVPGSCTDGGRGGEGLLHGAGHGSVVLVDSVLIGGPGGASPSASCSPGAQGPDSDVVAGTLDALPASGRGLALTPLVREGETLQQTLTGPVGEPLFLSYALDAGSAAFVPALAGTLQVSAVLVTRFVGLMPAAGVAQRPVVLAELGPGIEGVRLFVQGFHFDPLGVVLVASAPSPTVLLDGAF